MPITLVGVGSLSIKVRPVSLPTLGGLVIPVSVAEIGILVILSAQVSLAVLVVIVFLPGLGIPLIPAILPNRVFWYITGGVFYGPDTYQAEYEAAMSNWKPRGKNWAGYPIGRP